MRRLVDVEDLEGRLVVVRADLNVPLDDEGEIVDDTKIAAVAPTLGHLRDAKAHVVVLGHHGRPGGRHVPAHSLGVVAARLREHVRAMVAFAGDTTGPLARGALHNLAKGDIVVLENTRFEPGETACDPALAERLAAGAALFVDEAFGCAHRSHASNVGIGRIVPAHAGMLMEREITSLAVLRDDLAGGGAVAVVGGIKTVDKLSALEDLVGAVDAVLVGGALATTFIASRGDAVGRSICEGSDVQMHAQRVLEAAARSGCEILLPSDVVVTDGLTVDARIRPASADAIPDDCIALDIGPETAARYAARVREARIAVWDGPMGAFEMEPFAAGTATVAAALAEMEGIAVVGGGDAVAAARVNGHGGAYAYVSTGGAAMLEVLAGRTPPAVAAVGA